MRAAGEADFVYITVGEGAGAGIFLGGRIYHGARWSAGEIGYLHIPNVSRAHPTIHGHGKLEKIWAESGILKNWRAGVRGAKHESNVHARRRMSSIWPPKETCGPGEFSNNVPPFWPTSS